MIIISGLHVTDGSQELRFIPVDSNGSATAVHKYAAEGYYANGAQSWRTNSAHAYANIVNDIATGTDSQMSTHGTIHCFNPISTTAGACSYNWFLKSSKANEEAGVVYGAGNAQGTVSYTGFKIAVSANNISSATITCYGITNPA